MPEIGENASITRKRRIWIPIQGPMIVAVRNLKYRGASDPVSY